MGKRADLRSGGILIAALCGLVFQTACVSTQVENLAAFETQPLNRVVPYPDQAELRDRTVNLSIVHESTPGLADEVLVDARQWTRLAIETAALEQGAELQNSNGWGDVDFAAGGGLASTRAIRLGIRFDTYVASATWKRPFKFLWQSEEEVASKDGTCLHRADVAMTLNAVPFGKPEPAVRVFDLVHTAEEARRGLDPECPISETAKRALFEKTLDEALRCLARPLSGLLAPRGHITEHVIEGDTDRHLFRVSLGRAQGIVASEPLEIRREQRSVTPGGEMTRTERVIGVGVVSDQVDDQSAWIVFDPANASESVLDGDVVRPVREQGLLASLSGPNCSRILTERSVP